VAEQDRAPDTWTQAIDRFGQNFRALALQARFFGIEILVNEHLQTRLHPIVRILGQDFDNSPPSPEQHERFIHRDACQPSRELGFFLKSVQMKKCFVKAFLRHVFSIFPVIRNALRDGENFLAVTKNQFLESLRISTLCGGHQRFVGMFVRSCCAKRFHESNPSP